MLTDPGDPLNVLWALLATLGFAAVMGTLIVLLVWGVQAFAAWLIFST